MQVTMLTPMGEEMALSPQQQEALINSLRSTRPYYVQNFAAASSGELPKGVDCQLIDTSFPNLSERSFSRKKTDIQVKAAGFRSPNPRCEAVWTIEKDDQTGSKYVRLSHDTDAPQWIMAARFDMSSALRNKKILLVVVLRSTSNSSHVMVNLAPETTRPLDVRVDSQWRTYVIPMPQLQFNELRSVMVGLQGTGDVQISAVLVTQPPPFMSRLFEKQPGNPPNQPMGPGGKRR
jgi:hypothetical protein